MPKGKKLTIIFSGVLFCSLWLFFTQGVQENQLVSHGKSVDLMMNLAEENLRKYFETPLQMSESDVLPPFSFLLSLDLESLEPKFFAIDQNMGLKLSALSIKSAYKSLGDKSNLFVYTSKKQKDMPYLVRVSMTSGILKLEGLPLRNIQNTLDYAFFDQDWLLTDYENRVLVGSNESRQRLGLKDLESNYILNSVVVGDFNVNLYVKKDTGYGVALANVFGLLGIGLVTFSLLGFVGKGGEGIINPSLSVDKSEINEQMLFDDSEEEEIQMVRLEKSGLSSNLGNKEVFVESKSLVKEGKASNSSASADGELDYSDFLMENPILGDKTPFKNRPAVLEDKPLVENEDIGKSVFSIEREETTALQKTEEEEEGVASEDDISVRGEDDWLQLAEKLTESLEEFAQNYDDVTKDNQMDLKS